MPHIGLRIVSGTQWPILLTCMLTPQSCTLYYNTNVTCDKQNPAASSRRQHPWFAPGLPPYLATPTPALGLHGLPPLPDPAVLSALANLGIDVGAAAKAVQRRLHTQPAVAYHLLYDAAQRAAGGPQAAAQPSDAAPAAGGTCYRYPHMCSYHLLYNAAQRAAGGSQAAAQPSNAALVAGVTGKFATGFCADASAALGIAAPSLLRVWLIVPRLARPLPCGQSFSIVLSI